MNSANRQKYFITGASGSIGQAIIGSLRENIPGVGIFSERVDLLDKYLLMQSVPTGAVVIHLAAVTHAKDTNQYSLINVEGTKNLLEASKQAGVRHFVYISTTALGGVCGAYGASKQEAEEEVKKSGVPFTIIRPSEVYGTKSEEGISMIISFVSRFGIGPYIRGTVLAPVYIEDVVGGIVRASMLTPANKTYILSGPVRYFFVEAIGIIAKAYGKRVLPIPLPLFLARLKASAPDQVERLLGVKDYNNSLAKEELQFRPRSFEEGLRAIEAERLL